MSVIGSPFSPASDQFVNPFTVEPNLILLPHLPSWNISPSNGRSGFIFDFSLNVAPKLISVLPSVTLRTVQLLYLPIGNLFSGLQIKLNHLVKHYGEDYSKHLQY
jgi:hypothetical protein